MRGIALVAAAGLLAVGCKDEAAERQRALHECEIREGPPETRLFTQCLIDRFGWQPDTAHAYVVAAAESLQAQRDSIAQALSDSLERALAWFRDSLEKAQFSADSAAAAGLTADLAAARARRAAAVRAVEEERLAEIWVASDRTGQYYKGTCAAARRVTGDDRHEFSFEQPAINGGYKRSTEPGC